MTAQRILVTGTSGYLGLHIVNQLLSAGYLVRGSARGKKYELLKKAMAGNSAFEAVEIVDIGAGNFSSLLQGVDAVIHTAAPMPGRVGPTEALKYAADGAVHVLEEAAKAGIRRAVVTSSIVTFPFGGPYGVNDMNPITADQIDSHPYAPYVLQKTHADQVIMKFADAHPEMDITILGPSWMFGPVAAQFIEIVPEPDYAALATALYVYQLLRKDNKLYVNAPGSIDVRDAARLHVAALSSPDTEQRKRYVVASPYSSSWKGALGLIAKDRTELASRLADPNGAPDWPESENKIMVGREEQERVLGITRDTYVTWERTILDGVDSVLEIERRWKAAGFEVEPPQ
ncbi:NAD(P)-binding protein [Hymenopellis radicata]|nr:NAD(P)-binding protein [Hymenopellis radicata]